MTSSTLGSAVCAIVVLAGVLLVALIGIASLRSKLAYRERTTYRVTDITELAAYWTLPDNTGFASDSIAFGGTWASGKTIAITLTPVSGSPVVLSYVTGTNGDTTIATTIAQLLALINGSSAVTGSGAFLQAAVAATNQINFKALTAGTAGNGIAIAATITTGALTVTVASANFTAGAGSGTVGQFFAAHTGSLANNTATSPVGGRCDTKTPVGSTSPVFRVTAFFANAVSEVFDNIIGYATPGGGYNAAAFQANLATAVNFGTASRAPSAYWIYVPASSVNAPLTGTFFASAGAARTEATRWFANP